MRALGKHRWGSRGSQPGCTERLWLMPVPAAPSPCPVFPPGRSSGCCRCSRPRCSGSCRCSSAGGRMRRCCCSEPPLPCCCRSSAGSPASKCSSKSPPGGLGGCAGGWGVPGVGETRADVGALCPGEPPRVSSLLNPGKEPSHLLSPRAGPWLSLPLSRGMGLMLSLCRGRKADEGLAILSEDGQSPISLRQMAYGEQTLGARCCIQLSCPSLSPPSPGLWRPQRLP